MFENKKEAEAHDKMLELAESITRLLRQNIREIDENISHEVGLLLAKHSDNLAKACKGKPEALLARVEKTETEEQKVATLVTN